MMIHEDSDQNPIHVVIAARRGVMQEALKAMLADLPWLASIAFAGATKMVLTLNRLPLSRLATLNPACLMRRSRCCACWRMMLSWRPTYGNSS